MNSRCKMFLLIAVVILASVAVQAQARQPGTCASDSKLLNGGPTLVYGEGPGTFWGLVIDGLNAAGFETDDQKLVYLEQVFGRDFATFDEARQYNLDLLSLIYDDNLNGYICAFELGEYARTPATRKSI